MPPVSPPIMINVKQRIACKIFFFSSMVVPQRKFGNHCSKALWLWFIHSTIVLLDEILRVDSVSIFRWFTVIMTTSHTSFLMKFLILVTSMTLKKIMTTICLIMGVQSTLNMPRTLTVDSAHHNYHISGTVPLISPAYWSGVHTVITW
jgi:hypothetical protein